MLETREVFIDNRKVSVTQLPGRRAQRLLTRLLKMLSPSLGMLVANVNEGTSKKKSKKNTKSVTQQALDTEVKAEDIGRALQNLSTVLDPDDMINLHFEILASTRIQESKDSSNMLEVNNDENYDLLFGGCGLFLYKVIVFTLKVNYSDFFGIGGIGKIAGVLNTPAADQTK